MYLTPAEVNSHLYSEVTAKINRGDESLLTQAIDSAKDEAEGYLTAYDTDAIFAAEGADRLNILLLRVKDIAVWHFIQLANPAVDMELRLKRYEQALAWLKEVQAGKANPKLPYRQVPPPGEQNNYIKWGSNPKRGNYFN